MPENPLESPGKASPKVEVHMTPQELKAYAERRAKNFGDLHEAGSGSLNREGELSSEEKLASQLALDPEATQLGKDQREFQFLVRMKARAERRGEPMSEDFKQNYASSVMVLKSVDRNVENRAIYKQLQSI